jgi:ABC-2 type transport system ATP-binding protein
LKIIKFILVIVLEVRNIEKAYGATRALNGVSLRVPAGSIFGILGPNGSGKTTLLGIILDVLKADGGSFSWFERPGDGNQRAKIGSLLETPNFYHYLSGRRNLEITRRISKRGSREDIENVLRKARLAGRANSRFSTYSLGMKQRLAIAGALLGSPSVLVLDEPTNGLDPEGIAEIRELIVELRSQGHTIIIASHLLDEVEKVCTHAAIIKNGHLIVAGVIGEILQDNDQVALAARDMRALGHTMEGFPGVLSCVTGKDFVVAAFARSSVDPERVNEFCYKRGVILTHMSVQRQRLEERFFELTQNATK